LYGFKCRLASREAQITGHNVSQIKAKVIAEGANFAISQEADEQLNSKGIFVLPDLVVGGGEIVVSYYEWVQNLQQFKWTKENISTELVKSIANSFEAVLSKLESHSVKTVREAAYLLSLERLVEVTMLRGYQ